MSDKYTIGIATMDRTPFVIGTVKSLLTYMCWNAGNIIVLDQTLPEHISESDTLKIGEICKIAPVEWRFESIAGLTRARNLILKYSQASVVIFVDDDVMIHEEFLDSHLSIHRKYPHVIGVAAPVYHRQKDATIESLSVQYPHRGTSEHFANRNPGCFVLGWNEIMVGCNHSVKRRMLIGLGGYDEGIVGGYYEDSEISFRIRRNDKNGLAFNPKAWLLHLRAPSGGCRIVRNSRHSEAEKVSGYLIFGFRYQRGRKLIRQVWLSLRAGPLRKENVMNPRNYIPAFLGWLYAFYDAVLWRKRVRSLFNNKKMD